MFEKGFHFDQPKLQRIPEALEAIEPAVLYIVDDLLPQPSWQPDHAPNISRLISELAARNDLELCGMGWSTSVLIATRNTED